MCFSLCICGMMMSNFSADDAKPLDPAAARIVAKVRWLMVIAGATTFLAVAAVIGVIGYRLFKGEGSATSIADVTALLPKGARIVATALTQDATLVVSELAANAVVHARSDLTVTISRRRGAVRVAVHDDSLIAPSPQEPPGTLSSGRGMRLVGAIADDWGSDIAGEGKTVWADLATAAGPVPQTT